MTPSPLVGRRVRLIRCTDEHTRLEPGAEGTVTFVDDVGTVHVTWDSGARLGLAAEAGDRYEVLAELDPEELLQAARPVRLPVLPGAGSVSLDRGPIAPVPSPTAAALDRIAEALERLVQLGEARDARERFFLAESGIDLDGLFSHYATGRPIDQVALDPDGPLS